MATTNKGLIRQPRKVPLSTFSPSRKTMPVGQIYDRPKSAKSRTRSRTTGGRSTVSSSNKTSASKSSFDLFDTYSPVRHHVAPTLKERLQYMKRNAHRCVILAILSLVIIAAIIVTTLVVLARMHEELDNDSRITKARRDPNQTAIMQNTTTTSIELTSSFGPDVDLAALCINEHGSCSVYSPNILDNCSYIPCYSAAVRILYGHITVPDYDDKYQMQFVTLIPNQLHLSTPNGYPCYREGRAVGRCREINEAMVCVTADDFILPPAQMLKDRGIWKSVKSGELDVCLSFPSSGLDDFGVKRITLSDQELPWNHYDSCKNWNQNCVVPFKVRLRQCVAPTPNRGSEACFDVKSTVIPWPSYPVQLESCPDACQMHHNISINQTIDCEPAAGHFENICDLRIATDSSLVYNDFVPCCLPFFIPISGRSKRIYNQSAYRRKMGRCVHGLCVEVVDS